MTNDPLQDRRKTKRRFLMFYARVFDRRTGRQIGYVADLTPDGMMLISETPIMIGETYHLRMDLPEDLSQRPSLDFQARSIWNKPDIDPDYIATGLQLLNVGEGDIAIIKKIVESYGFRD
jgi:hypothetical protein